MDSGFHTGFFVREGGGGGGAGKGDLLKRSHLLGRQACLTEIMTSEIQKVRANKLVVNNYN